MAPKSLSDWCTLRIFLRVLQICGYFPYSWKKGKRFCPSLSVYMVLWTVLVNCLTMIYCCIFVSAIWNQIYTAHTTGIIVTILTGGFIVVSSNIRVLLCIWNAKYLAAFVRVIAAVNASEKWCRNQPSVLMILTDAKFTVCVYCHLYLFIRNVMCVRSISCMNILLLLDSCSIFYGGLTVILILALSLKSFASLLHSAVDEMNVSVSKMKSKDVWTSTRFQEQQSVSEKLGRLMEHLDEVDELQSNMASYTSGFLSTFFITSVGYTIVQTFRVVTGGVGFGWEFFDLVAMNAIPIGICLSGQMYTDQVTEIERKIERWAIENQEPMMLSHMSLCLMKLGRMRTFDVCGWFTLGHQTLVGMATFIATYLVILLQVGGEHSFSFEAILEQRENLTLQEPLEV